jgi:peptidoglycan/LPS O-acetylase OafA/YrhL
LIQGNHRTQDRDLALEGVRGLCAVLVVFGHMTYMAPVLDPGYACDLLHIDFGPQAVLVFFVLSGYVIGLATTGPATRGAIGHYCSRRLLRIVPIAWIAIAFTWILLGHDRLGTAIGNLLFLQNSQPYPFGLRVPVLDGDPPLWSLSLEMLFYAAFIAVWAWRPRMRTLVLAVIALSFCDRFGLPGILAHQAAYFVYWLAGLCLAWRTEAPSPAASVPWPASLAAAFVTWSIEPLHTLLETASPRLAALDSDRYHLDALLGAVLVVAAVTRRAPGLRRTLTAIGILLGLAVIPLKYRVGYLSYLDLIGAAILCACILARGWRPTLRPLAALAPIGAVSYGLYATAFPLMRLVFRSPFLPSGCLGTFLLRAVILAALCAATAVFLERFMQPRIVRWLKTRLGLRPSDLPGAASSTATR